MTRGSIDEGPGDRHALGLAARHLAGAAALEAVEAEPREPRPRDVARRSAPRLAVEEQRQRHVLDRRQLRDELAELEHEAERRAPQPAALGVAQLVDAAPVERDLAARPGP